MISMAIEGKKRRNPHRGTAYETRTSTKEKGRKILEIQDGAANAPRIRGDLNPDHHNWAQVGGKKKGASGDVCRGKRARIGARQPKRKGGRPIHPYKEEEKEGAGPENWQEEATGLPSTRRHDRPPGWGGSELRGLLIPSKKGGASREGGGTRKKETIPCKDGGRKAPPSRARKGLSSSEQRKRRGPPGRPKTGGGKPAIFCFWGLCG